MSIFRIFERHPHADISAYADRELAPERCDRLERHLESCAACRDELADLRAMTSAFSDLPEVAAPRSFALTPGQVAETPRELLRQPSGTPAFVAMRVAGAGVAAVLAVVVLLDTGGAGTQTSNSDNDAALISEATEIQADDAAGEPRDAEGLDSAYGGSDSPPANVVGDDGEGADDGSVNPQAPDALPVSTDLTTSGGDNKDSLDEGAGEALGPNDGDDSAGVAFEQATSEDGGISTLLIIEIALGVVAVAAIGGGFLLPRFIRNDN